MKNENKKAADNYGNNPADKYVFIYTRFSSNL